MKLRTSKSSRLLHPFTCRGWLVRCSNTGVVVYQQTRTRGDLPHTAHSDTDHQLRRSSRPHLNWVQNRENKWYRSVGQVTVEVLSETSIGPSIEHVDTLREAMDMLTDPSLPEFDLVISHWGYNNHVGENLLKQIRNLDVAVPVIIFASGFRTEVNRPTALSLGAFDYVSSFEGLFSALNRLFIHDQ
jgi:CheY-like chemotaxis protein